MALESLTDVTVFITNLVKTNPTDSDDAFDGDDHIRGIKNVLQNTFPKLSGQASMTPAELNLLVGMTSLASHQPSASGILAPHKNLVCKYVTAATVDIDADEVLLTDSSGDQLLVSSVNLTLDITASGDLGLDTGAEAGSTWYYLWVMSDGTTTTGRLSTSASAPTMGSNTYKGLVGAVYNDATPDFVDFHQRDRQVSIPPTTTLSGGGATTFTALSLGNVIPPEAVIAYGLLVHTTINAAQVVLAPFSDGKGQVIVQDPAGDNNIAAPYYIPVMDPTSPPRLWYKVSAGLANMATNGYAW